MIRVQRAEMNKAVQEYLQTPAAKNVRKEFGLPTWILVGVGAFQGVMGCLEMITIVKFRSGVKNLIEGLTLKALRDQTQGSPEKFAGLKPVIGHLVYGNSSNGLGVVLGSLAAAPNETTLVALAQQLGNLYAQATPEESRKLMWRILKDDTYQPYRRRQLVEPFNVEPDATLFDVNLNLRDGSPTPWQTVMFAFVTTEGEICQIPWAVVKPFVSVSPTGQ